MEELRLRSLSLVTAPFRISGEDPICRNRKSSLGGIFGGSEEGLESDAGSVRVPSRSANIEGTVKVKEDTANRLDVDCPWLSRRTIRQ